MYPYDDNYDNRRANDDYITENSSGETGEVDAYVEHSWEPPQTPSRQWDTGSPFPPSVQYYEPGRKKRRWLNSLIAVAMVAAMFLSGSTGAWVMRQYMEAGVEEETSAALNTASETASLENAGSSTDTNEQHLDTVSVTDNGNDSVVTAVVKKAAASVVEINTETTQFHPFYGQYVSTGAGSGVILTSNGYIVTNYHVIEGASGITIRLNDGTEYAASVVGYDADNDLAVIKVDASGLTSVSFADSGKIEVGQLAVAIGNPLGQLGGTVTEGIISATGRTIYMDDVPMTLLQTSAAINPGNSGGGLFDKNGDLVGIVNAKSSGSDIEGLGFAIPSNTVKEVVNKILGSNSIAA